MTEPIFRFKPRSPGWSTAVIEAQLKRGGIVMATCEAYAERLRSWFPQYASQIVAPPEETGSKMEVCP